MANRKTIERNEKINNIKAKQINTETRSKKQPLTAKNKTMQKIEFDDDAEGNFQDEQKFITSPQDAYSFKVLT